MIKLLLRPDIINHMDNTGETALSTAVAFSNEGLVEMLLERGALPTLRASPGAHSALQSAWCQPGYTNDSIREMLRKAVSKQEFAQIAVHGSDAVSAEQQAFAAARSGDRKTLERLLKTQPSLLQATTEAGHTLMMLATIHGKLDLAKLLCDNGADMDAASNSRDTALLYAIRHGHAHVASFLIKKGADVNCRNADGCRPLAYAASKGLASTVVKLLERRADITEYLDNKSLFECATKSGNLETIQVVIARLAESAKDREALNYAFVHCVYDGSGPTQDDEYLAYAELLLDAGVDIDTNFFDLEQEKTALMFLAGYADERMGGAISMARMLIARGADLQRKDARGQTALDIARANGCQAMIELLSGGAPVSTASTFSTSSTSSTASTSSSSSGN